LTPLTPNTAGALAIRFKLCKDPKPRTTFPFDALSASSSQRSVRPSRATRWRSFLRAFPDFRSLTRCRIYVCPRTSEPHSSTGGGTCYPFLCYYISHPLPRLHRSLNFFLNLSPYIHLHFSTPFVAPVHSSLIDPKSRRAFFSPFFFLSTPAHLRLARRSHPGH